MANYSCDWRQALIQWLLNSGVVTPIHPVTKPELVDSPL